MASHLTAGLATEEGFEQADRQPRLPPPASGQRRDAAAFSFRAWLTTNAVST
jgi:hypothetical protein